LSVLYSVIIAGGHGTRLWPITENLPKPLLKPFGEKTLLELTINRLSLFTDRNKIFISTTRDLAIEIRKELPHFPEENYIIEPCCRNTAASVALAVCNIRCMNEDAIIGIFPADHLILDERYFSDFVKKCCRQAAVSDNLILAGLLPKAPVTSYGYIQKGKCVSVDNDLKFFAGEGFLEKPLLQKARELIAANMSLWNCGIYIGKISVFEDEFKKTMPEMFGKVNEFYSNSASFQEIYSNFDSVSFDKGVTERIESFIVAESGIERMDMGNIKDIASLWPKDKYDNSANGKLMVLNSSNNIVHFCGKPIVLIGVENHAVIDTKNVLMICHRSMINEVDKMRQMYMENCAE